jgi:hypothetical protein
MTHYVILFDWTIDHMSESGIEVVAVTHTLDEAKSIFAKRVSDEKQYAFDHGYEIYTDTDTEFDAGEDGFYAAEHAHFYIETVNDESEIVRDLTEDAVNRDIEDCPFGGDISDDCADCAYGEDYHYSDSECKEREDK